MVGDIRIRPSVLPSVVGIPIPFFDIFIDMITLLITIGFISLFFILMSVRLIFLKGGEFKGTCASQGNVCEVCGKKGDDIVCDK